MDTTVFIHTLLNDLDDDIFHLSKGSKIRHLYVPGLCETIAIGIAVVYLSCFFNVGGTAKRQRAWLNRLFSAAKTNTLDSTLDKELSSDFEKAKEFITPSTVSEADKEAVRIQVSLLLEEQGMSVPVADSIVCKLERVYFQNR